MRSAPATLALAVALALAAFSPPPLAAAIRPDDCLAARRAETGHEAACYSLVQDGRKRTLRVYVPRARGGPLPVVLVLHSCGWRQRNRS